jgi:6-pyruvoyltetrahydropterin/6-carboxytetrahydropterin synthase
MRRAEPFKDRSRRPMMELTRVYHFSAAHRLESPMLTAEDNRRRYGRCAGIHGHNYYLEVTVQGEPDPVTGMLIDIGRVDAVVEERVLDHVDHQSLEAVDQLAGVITTGESLARAFWALLAPELPAGALARVAVVETAKNRFEYAGEAA